MLRVFRVRYATWRELRQVVGRADVVLEVVDARVPDITRSRKVEKLVERLGRSLIIVINKCDLIPKHVAESWKKFFETQGYSAVFISARERLGTRILRSKIRESAGKKPIVAAIVGYPKVGKSTIINILKGKHSAPTSPIPGSPGYTTHVRTYRIGKSLYIIDTPGVIPPLGENVLAFLRGKDPESFKDPVKPVVEFLKILVERFPNIVKEVYGVESNEPYRILEEIALKRKWIYKKTKEPIIEEAAKLIMRDWFKEKIAVYSTPDKPLIKLENFRFKIKFR
ncbi:MAG: GTP-binding protein [Thermoprotei archaeon]|nr:MAG: GTP-binding protein [Thermoprotei archaeon]